MLFVNPMSPRSGTVLTWLEGLSYDLRFALLGLRRDRAFTLAAIATLALAIGLNVTVFTVMNTMLFRGLPAGQEKRPAGLYAGAISIGIVLHVLPRF
jgi:hypothetical protein